MFKNRDCIIQKKIKIICPYCSRVIELPMCKVVNGEQNICPYCQKKIKVDM